MKKNKYLPLIIFFISFVVYVLGDRFMGQGYRGNLTPIESLTWEEIFSNLPVYLIMSLLLTFIVLKMLKLAKKEEAKNTENARKRIEEREKEKRMSKQNNQKRNQK